jgi:hypothetical protein
MRRSLAAVCAAILMTATVLAGPARADTVIQFVVDATADAAPDFSTTGTTGSGSTDFFVDLTKVAPGFLSKYVVLDAKIVYDLGLVLDPTCTPNLTLRTSDATHASGDYVRRSAASNTSVQRVAIAKPQDPYYLLQVRRDGTGFSTSGACVTVQSIPFTLTVRLYASKPQSTGFGFAPVHLPTSGDGEPSIAVDRLHGDATYVSAPVGVPAILGGNQGGVDFWRSFDHAASWSYSQPFFTNSTGGGDSHVVVDTAGDVFLADLAATNIWVGKSTDHGATFASTTPAGIVSDRQWLATWTAPGAVAPAKVFLYFHSLNADNLPYECISLDGGTVWQPVCNPMVTDPVTLANAFDNTIVGPQAFDSHGVVHAVMATPTAGDPNATFRNIYLMSSSDGIVFTDKLVYSAPVGSDVAALFPVITIDTADNMYVAWSERVAPNGASTVRMAWSTDGGLTWSAPVNVSPTGGGAVLPWITAGAPGKVDVTWVGTTSAGNNDPTADWYQWMAQSTNALSGAPTFTLGRVSSQPTRYGTVCLSGLGCSTSFDDGRILLDFTSVDRDSAGDANIAFADSGPEGPAGNESRTFTDVGRQTKGTTVTP